MSANVSVVGTDQAKVRVMYDQEAIYDKKPEDDHEEEEVEQVEIKQHISNLEGLNTCVDITFRIKGVSNISFQSDLLKKLVVERLKNSQHRASFAGIDEVQFDFKSCVVDSVTVTFAHDMKTDRELQEISVYESVLKITDAQDVTLTQTSGVVLKEGGQPTDAVMLKGCILSPLMQAKEQVVYKNNEKVSNRHRYIADVNLMYLTDTTETTAAKPYRLKAYVFHTPLPNGEVRAVISKAAVETLNMLSYACESELFEFGDVDKKEFYAWKDNDLYTDRDGFKFMPWNVFSKIKESYRTLRSQFRYTHNLNDVKLLFTDFENTEKKIDGILAVKFAFFVPIGKYD
ncbi:hypothetical protein CYMTET_47717 [Cymbomonas tetramitiformis]|uniref:Uncharacterized protein n=1 Tax=Cymbomonas tetramitiformis TaxID=36881 RepID=A0AAE0EVN0_9CHLO|nr:hypothetical protein CYMTET_47717 [Cymbomonas tetramitiformis]|eukprot:gene589-991_t